MAGDVLEGLPIPQDPDPSSTPKKRTISFAPDPDFHPPSPDRIRALSPPPTPLKPRMDTATSKHVKETLNALIESDLVKSRTLVTFNQWVECICGISKPVFNGWVEAIRRQKWFEDDVIQDSLIDYCRATDENGRYEPLVRVLNRIAELARGSLPGISVENSYPIDDLCFVRHDKNNVQTVPEHGSFGALRRPDLICVRRSVAERLSAVESDHRAQWSDILYWCEMKYNDRLISILQDKRSKHNMSRLKSNGLPMGTRRNTGKKAKTKAKSTSKPTGRGRATKKNEDHPSSEPALEVEPLPELDPTPEEEPASKEESISAGVKRKAASTMERGLYAGYQYARAATSIRNLNSRDPRLKLINGWHGAMQSASYAMELSSCTYGTRTFCIGNVIHDDRIYPWYYDASGIIGTVDFVCLVSKFEVAAAFFVALARCSPEQIGVIPQVALNPPPSKHLDPVPHDLHGYLLHMQHPTTGEDVNITLNKLLFSQYVLVGRRTFLYSASSNVPICKAGIAVKFSYQATTRTPEQQLLSVATSAGVKHLPSVHMSADLWKLSDGVRQIFYEKTKGEANYEDRVLRAIVYTEYAPIRPLFAERIELLPVMVDQMIDCLHNLRYKANMLHRDISVNNIMFQVRNGKYYFILIDFDMAIILHLDASRDGERTYVAASKFRTGTLPFMACSLLYNAALSDTSNWTAVKHLLCHDFESLFWGALHCILTLFLKTVDTKTRELFNNTVQSWEKGDLKSIASKKERLCVRALQTSGIVLPPPAKKLDDWFLAWSDIFERSVPLLSSRDKVIIRAQKKGTDPPPFDAETIGGTFTREVLKAHLTPVMPFHQDDDGMDSEDDIPVDHAAQDEAGQTSMNTASVMEVKPQNKPQGRRRGKKLQAALNVVNDIRSRLRPRKRPV